MTRHRSPHDSGGVLDLRYDLDPERITRAFNSMRRSLEEMGRAVQRAVRSLAPLIRRAQAAMERAANEERAVAGLCARYQVRGGLDPACASAAGIDALVASIMRGEADDTRLLTVSSRALVAAAALRGWTDSYPAPLPVLTWHRLMAGTRIEVTRA